MAEWIIDDEWVDDEALGLAEMTGKATELIKCKDCKYWQDNNGGYPNPNCKWNGNETPDADDYCSGAERKEG